jgi:LacI family transcriptional regulator
MNKGKTTIHDISKALGIDSSTVSRALNDSPRVSKKTKEIILKKAQELGYQRNILASNLRTNRTHTIAVVVPRISRHFFATVIAGIEETAYEAGYNVIICQSLDALDREKKIMATLLSNRVDGILISISMETIDYEHILAYKNLGNPIIFFDRPCHLPNCSNINIDNHQASFKATEHLILNGCKEIAHLSGSQDIELYRHRKNGYIAALQHYKMNVREDYIFESNLSEEDGIQSAKQILELKGIDGLYASNDTSAISAMQYFKSQGIRIPEDIAVVGFNNDPISAVIEPSLTTINQPAFEIGKIASSLLLKQIETKSVDVEDEALLLSSELIIRNSSIR